jgi:hypothetical protein
MTSKLLRLLATVAALALAGIWGCDGGSSDGDGDVDSDVDSDSDADTDSDTDVDVFEDCGALGEECCPVEPSCMDDLVCAQRSGEEMLCFEPCEPNLCDYGEQQGYCVPYIDGVGVCAALEAATLYCDWDGCETEYGVSDDTRCVQNQETWETFCFESCDLVATGCDETTHECIPLADGGGVCRPR